MMNQNVQPRSKPSAAFYVLGVLLILGGFAFGFAQCAKRISGFVKEPEKAFADLGLIHMVAPGRTTLTLSEPGKYTIYHEHVSIVDDEPFSSADVDPNTLDYVVTNTETGEQIAVSTPMSEETYDLPNREATAIRVFTVDKAGEYELVARYQDGRAEPKLVLSVGQGVLKKVMGWVVVPLAAMGLGLLIGLVIIIVTAVARGRASRAAYGYPPPPYQPPYQQPPQAPPA